MGYSPHASETNGCGSERRIKVMPDNPAIPQMVSDIVKVVFLICLVALIPLGAAEWSSGQNAPYETQTTYDMLEKILVGIILLCIFVWVIAEAWREIRSLRLKGK
jgi:hypothetical protein